MAALMFSKHAAYCMTAPLVPSSSFAFSPRAWTPVLLKKKYNPGLWWKDMYSG
jgi:hypothetical protein